MLRAEVYEKNKMMKESASDYRKALELILKIKG
jgi:Tfp pilus assembly protein PilF